MTTIDIERLLRQPAHDEPAILPALVLPHETATGGLRDRSLDTPLGFGRMTLTMRVAIAALLLAAALVGALASGTLRLEQLNAPLSDHGTFTGRGDHPVLPAVVGAHHAHVRPRRRVGRGAHRLERRRQRLLRGPGRHAHAGARLPRERRAPTTRETRKATSTASAIASTRACIEKPMAPGEVRVVVSRYAPQRIQVGPIGDFEEPFVDPSVRSGVRCSSRARPTASRTRSAACPPDW